MAQDRHAIIIAVAILMIVLATVAVILRFQARRVRKTSLKADDYFIVFALVTTQTIMSNRIIANQ